MAYASTSSPFAAVKGQNIFHKTAETSAPHFLPVNQDPVEPLSSPFTSKNIPQSDPTPSSSTSTPMRFGFEAFASPLSPFSSVARSKSPVLGSSSKFSRAKSPVRRNQSVPSSAFSPYAGTAQSFVIPPSKRVRSGSPSNSSRSSLERNSAIGVIGTNGAGQDSGTEDDREDDRLTSFGEKLRAGRDDEDDNKSDEEQGKVVLTEQDSKLCSFD